MDRRWNTLDEALEHINSLKREVPEVKEAAPQEQVEEESRWWSYTSKQDIIPEGEATQHTASEHSVPSDPGFSYQRCGGGRRVIRRGRNS